FTFYLSGHRRLSFGDTTMKWRIGDWVACTDTDTLRNGVAHQKIERRAMEALVALAGRSGGVMRKDELIETVWGRIAVSDHSVAMVISQLRRALKDEARAPTYIETITKRGYRMMVPCEPLAETPVAVRVPRAIEPAARIALNVQPTMAVRPQMGLVLASAGVA